MLDHEWYKDDRTMYEKELVTSSTQTAELLTYLGENVLIWSKKTFLFSSTKTAKLIYIENTAI